MAQLARHWISDATQPVPVQREATIPHQTLIWALDRALRVMRVSLLAGELKQMNISSSGALLSGAASVRLFQLVASVLTLLFTTSSIVRHSIACAQFAFLLPLNSCSFCVSMEKINLDLRSVLSPEPCYDF